MRRPHIFPSNGWYTLALCGILAASAVYLSRSFDADFTDWESRAQALSRMPAGDWQPPPRGRRLKSEDGKDLLWASGDYQSEDAKWWDMTDALIDPARFDHGIGADRIPSIDAPEFATVDDPRFKKFGFSKDMAVIGVEIGGEARAYPVALMARHEIVNDVFGEAHLAVAY